MRRSLTAVPLSLLVFSLGLAACGDDDVPVGSPKGSMSEQMDDDPGDMHDHDESSPVAAGARRVEVSATSFEFDPDEMTIDAGEDIAIVLTSDDILHDFTIDDLDVHVAAGRGETAEGGLRADEPGEYTYYCTVAGHREAGMEGTLVVRDS